jgi:site-specific DNA recombinase
MQQGKDACGGGSVPATELENLVVDHIRAIGKDPEVVLATLREAQRQLQAKLPALKAEKAALTAEVARQREERDRLVTLVASGHDAAGAATDALAGLQESIGRKGARLAEIRIELRALKAATVDEADLRKALEMFDPVWDALYPAERRRVLRLLVERVDYDAAGSKVILTFRVTGIRMLAAEATE